MKITKKLLTVMCVWVVCFNQFAPVYAQNTTWSLQDPSTIEDVKKEDASTEQTIQAPTETTIFLQNPETILVDPVSSEDVYYSKNPLEFDIEQALETMKTLDLGINEISDKIRDLDKEYSSNDTQYKKTRDEVMYVINDIRDTKESLKLGIQKIRTYQRIILQWWQKIEEIRSDVQQMKDYIAQFTTYLYKLHNDLYDKDGDINEIKLYIEADWSSLITPLSNAYLVETFVSKIDELVERLRNHEKQQIQRIKTSIIHKINARQEMDSYKNKIENLEQKRKYLVEYLELYKSNKSKIEWTIATLFDTRKDVHASIVESIQQIKEKTYVATFDMKERLTELQALEPYAEYERASSLSWPLLPVQKIWTYYKDKQYEQTYGVEHYWIEIPAQQLTPLYAADDGVVYTITDDQSLWVNRVLLVHKNNIITVYQYVNSFFIKEWDIVRRGQLIWYSWWEPWTSGAWFISKRPNLTFSVVRDGKFVDPLWELELSVFKNKSLLAQKYHIKYLKDLYRRPRDIHKIEFMPWDTLNERRVAFLEKYWVGIYRQLAFWLDAAADSKIDPDLWICIAFAESTLGNYLSTPNNIGNVWNNDRWDRVSFWSALQWASLIYQTLNNQYLGQYNTIIELNWYGNKTGKIYASSPYNRQNNVVNCLSQIKWRYVPDDYSFRIAK